MDVARRRANHRPPESIIPNSEKGFSISGILLARDARARLLLEADVFWATEAVGIEELNSWLSVYQLSRDMTPRGIVEVINYSPTAAALPRRSLTVVSRTSPATKNSTVDKMASRWLPAVR